MAAILLTLTLTAVLAGVSWLAFGNRFALHADERQNEVLNLLSYAGVICLPVFLIVFFAMERL